MTTKRSYNYLMEKIMDFRMVVNVGTGRIRSRK